MPTTIWRGTWGSGRVSGSRAVDLRAVAIQWVLRNPKVGCTLVGARDGDQMAENVASALSHVPDEIWPEVEERIHSGRGQSHAAGGEAQ